MIKTATMKHTKELVSARKAMTAYRERAEEAEALNAEMLEALKRSLSLVKVLISKIDVQESTFTGLTTGVGGQYEKALIEERDYLEAAIAKAEGK